MKIEEQVLTIEQSKHLQELGLDMSDAAFGWYCPQIIDDYDPKVIIIAEGIRDVLRGKQPHVVTDVIPTYTLQEVLNELPDVIYVEFNKGRCILRHEYIDGVYSIYYDTEDGDMIGLVDDCSFLEAAYKMLCWILENGYLK